MTPLPKRRHSTRRQGKRRAALSVAIPNLVICPNCKEPTLQHQACRSCGFYKGTKSPQEAPSASQLSDS